MTRKIIAKSGNN